MRLVPSVIARATAPFLIGLAACSSGGVPDSIALPEPVASVAVTAAATVAAVGQAVQCSAIPRAATGAPLPDRSVSWSSSAPAVAVVSPTGLVTAVAPGAATISASSEGQSGSVPLTVTAPVTVASVSVAAPVSTLTIVETAQLTATVRDASGAVLTGRTVTWTTSNASVASVSSSGLVTGTSAGTSIITATSEGHSGSVPITVTAPTVTGSNEPTGLTLISDRHFAALNEAGWTDYKAANFSFVADSTSPQPQATVGQVLYPAGFVAGSEPVNLYTNLGNRQTLYLSFWLKISPNFYGHAASSVNKIFHIWIGGSNRIYLAAMGAGMTPSFQPQARLQGVPTQANYNLGPNLVPGATLVRDRWYKWEVVLRANTPGVADGSVEFWINGVKVANYPTVAFVAAGQGNSWETINWAPTYGGIGGSVPYDMWMRMSEIYLSGR